MFIIESVNERIKFTIGIQSFYIDYLPEDEEDCTAEQKRQWMCEQLRIALSKLCEDAVIAERETCAKLVEEEANRWKESQTILDFQLCAAIIRARGKIAINEVNND